MTTPVIYYNGPQEIDGPMPKQAKTCDFYTRNMSGKTIAESNRQAETDIHTQLMKYYEKNNFNYACFKSSTTKQGCGEGCILTDLDVVFYVW